MDYRTALQAQNIIFTDTETFSTVDIKTAGAVKYAQNAEMLLAGFKLNNEYEYYDYHHNPEVPEWVYLHIERGGFLAAHNALFDYLILKPHIPTLTIEQMVDTQAIVAAHGLPLSLEKSGAALNLDKQKYKGGARLIKLFCIPRKPTKYNESTRVHACDEPDKWVEFRDVYLKADVDTMEIIYNKLSPLSEREQQVWVETQYINLRGVPIDAETNSLIIKKLDTLIDDESTSFIRQTGIFPTQRDKILKWCQENGGKIQNLQAATVKEFLAKDSNPIIVRKALETRANISHMSFKKFPVMQKALCDDGTVKGTLMYHVAGTGRFGGRLLQTQNLTKGNIDGEEAVLRILAGEFSVELVKSSVRSMIYHEDGFSVVDYSSIEARVLQWFSGDEEALQVFRDGLDPYIWMAQKIYGKEYDKITSKERFVGKQAVLGLGYSMSYKKFIMMVEKYGETISVPEAKKVVSVYRDTHRKTVKLWGNMNLASVMAVKRPNKVIKVNRYVSFKMRGDFLFMLLPSGRELAYYLPQVDLSDWGSETISYMSMNEKNQYVRTRTYGGKLTENAVQAISRDLLVDAVSRLIKADFKIVTHIHDEIVAIGMDKYEEMKSLMCVVSEWAIGVPINVSGFTSMRFKKG